MSDDFLSIAGEVRRNEIGRLVRRAAGRRRARRWAGRASVAIALLAITAAVWPRGAASGPMFVARRVAPPPPSVVLTYLQTDPTIADRLAVRPEVPRWTVIGDHELLQALAAAGQPAGIATINGRERLLFRSAPRP